MNITNTRLNYDALAMRNFTKDGIAAHLLSTAAPLALSILVQAMHPLVDLYFITGLGVAAVAGMNAAGSALFIVSALLQILVVGTVAPIAHAAGRRDNDDANLVFNQALALACVCGLILSAFLGMLVRPYMTLVSGDSATVRAGATYIWSVLPGYALLLPMGVLSCAMRATGHVRATIAPYVTTVFVNTALAPILIEGWGTGIPLGTIGAGLGTSLSVIVGLAFVATRFRRMEPQMAWRRNLLRPQFAQWRRILAIGLPAGGEFAITFLSNAVVYYAIQGFGTSAQAGFSIGWRVLQLILVPAMALATAAGPIAGQNFGAKNPQRVRETFHSAVLIGVGLMLVITALVQWRPTAIVGMFDADTAAIAIAAVFVQLLSLTLASQSIVYTCLSLFQGLGNTVPSLGVAAVRFIGFSVPVLYLTSQASFRIEHLWYVSMGAILLQALAGWLLLRVEFRKRLAPIERQHEEGAAGTAVSCSRADQS